MRHTFWVAAGMASLTVSCVLDQPSIYQGLFASSFEGDPSFRPCGFGNVAWLVEGDLGSIVDMVGVSSEGEAYAFVRLKGRLSGLGHYGQEGGYPRRLTITNVLEVRHPTPDDCTMSN
jgi:hypothetical protein